MNNKYFGIIGILVVVIIYLYFNKDANIDYNTKLHELTEKSTMLGRKNDSLSSINKKLDSKIDSIVKEKVKLNEELVSVRIEIKKLKDKRNEIPNYVNHLSANGVANEFTKYLDKKTKGRNNN